MKLYQIENLKSGRRIRTVKGEYVWGNDNGKNGDFYKWSEVLKIIEKREILLYGEIGFGDCGILEYEVTQSRLLLSLDRSIKKKKNI